MAKFLVLVTAYREVIVEAPNKTEAARIAADECSDFKWDINEWKATEKLKNAEAVEAAKRHGAVDLEDW